MKKHTLTSYITTLILIAIIIWAGVSYLEIMVRSTEFISTGSHPVYSAWNCWQILCGIR